MTNIIQGNLTIGNSSILIPRGYTMLTSGKFINHHFRLTKSNGLPML